MLSAQQMQKAKATFLSDNFTLYELIRSDSHPEMVNYPSEEIIQHLKDFCQNVLQPLRDKYGPIRINSGYRNRKLNSAVGGVANSIHQIMDSREVIFQGVAVDIVPLKYNVVKMFEEIQKEPGAIKTAIIYRKPNVTRTPFIHIDNRLSRTVFSPMEKIGPNTYVPYKG